MTTLQAKTVGSRFPPQLPGGAPWPRISVVTPSFGHGAFIEETILSVLSQGYPDVEHIIIDGGSRDGTAAILEPYRDRLAYVVSEPDRGQSHAINKGMAHATGEILTWLNSDDRLAPDALAGVAMAFHTSGADMVAGICELWRDGQVVERHLTSCSDGLLPLADLLDLDGGWNAGQFFFQPEVFFTRELWRRAGGRVDEQAHFSMDYELWLRFAAAGARLKVIGRPVAQFRLHPDQKTADPRGFQAELPEVRQRFMARHGLGPVAPSRRDSARVAARIVFFNDIGGLYGAGIAHERLATAAAMAGNEVIRITASSKPQPAGLEDAELQQRLRLIESAAPDLVVVGNLHGAGVPPAVLSDISARWPTAFVVHDLWIVTGRCAYTGGCLQFLSGCSDSCPTPAEYPPLAPEFIGSAWAAKRQLNESPQAPLLFANSEWTRTQVNRALTAQSSASGRVHVLRLGVPDAFVPRDRDAARRLLGLPLEAFLVLLSATALQDERKGGVHLRAALATLSLAGLELVLVGSGEGMEIDSHPVHRLHYIESPDTLATVYSACDLFVGPSLEECFGQVFVEAAACGLPAVGYPVGGVPEAIADGITGLLTSDATPEALAATIRFLHADSALRAALSAWAPILVGNERTLEASYHSLYDGLHHGFDAGRSVLGRKIAFRPLRPHGSSELRAVRHQSGHWEAVDGFGPWEGPYPALGLGRCRWQEHPEASFVLTAKAYGAHQVTLRFRSLAAAQRVQLWSQGTLVFNGQIAANDSAEASSVTVSVSFHSLQTHWRCVASSCVVSEEGRELYLLLSSVEVITASNPSGRELKAPSRVAVARAWFSRLRRLLGG